MCLASIFPHPLQLYAEIAIWALVLGIFFVTLGLLGGYFDRKRKGGRDV